MKKKIFLSTLILSIVYFYSCEVLEPLYKKDDMKNSADPHTEVGRVLFIKKYIDITGTGTGTCSTGTQIMNVTNKAICKLDCNDAKDENGELIKDCLIASSRVIASSASFNQTSSLTISTSGLSRAGDTSLGKGSVKIEVFENTNNSAPRTSKSYDFDYFSLKTYTDDLLNLGSTFSGTITITLYPSNSCMTLKTLTVKCN